MNQEQAPKNEAEASQETIPAVFTDKIFEEYPWLRGLEEQRGREASEAALGLEKELEELKAKFESSYEMMVEAVFPFEDDQGTLRMHVKINELRKDLSSAEGLPLSQAYLVDLDDPSWHEVHPMSAVINLAFETFDSDTVLNRLSEKPAPEEKLVEDLNTEAQKGLEGSE